MCSALASSGSSPATQPCRVVLRTRHAYQVPGPRTGASLWEPTGMHSSSGRWVQYLEGSQSPMDSKAWVSRIKLGKFLSLGHSALCGLLDLMPGVAFSLADEGARYHVDFGKGCSLLWFFRVLPPMTVLLLSSPPLASILSLLSFLSDSPMTPRRLPACYLSTAGG